MKDYEAAKRSYEEVLEQFVERLPPKKRLRGLTPEQRLEGLAPEQVVKAFPPEEVAEVLTPEQRLKGLTVDHILDHILAALTREEREQLAKKLH